MAEQGQPTAEGLPFETDRKEASAAPIRWRAIVLGTSLAWAICLVTPFNNAYRQGTPLGGGHFPLAPFYLLLGLMVVMALLRYVLRGRTLLTGRELLVTWALMVLLSGVAWTGLARTFFINLTAPIHFATVENRWEEVLNPLMPHGWYPRDAEAVFDFYNGITGGRDLGWGQILYRIPWDAWIGPLLVWLGFILLCYLVMICIINLLSKQPLYNERMNFPLLRVPLLMQEAYDGNRLGRFFTNRFLLAGMAIPICLHLVNGLSFYHPTIPSIPTLVLAGKYFPKYGLFSAFYKLKIYFFPAFIGFAFLTSKQISFSFWLFYLAGLLLSGFLGFLGISIPAGALGTTFGPVISHPEETQMIGAYIVFFIFLAWLARFHLMDTVGKAVGLRKESRDESDWLSTRMSFWGFVVGMLAIVGWCWYFGLPLLMSFLVIGVFFMFTLVAMRVICQGGLAYFTLTAAPLDALLAFFSSRTFTHVGLLVAAVAQKVLFVDLRESLMPSLLHTRKITDGMGNGRRFAAVLVITLAVGIVISFAAMLALCYKFGVRELQLEWATNTTISVYENIYNLTVAPQEPGKWVMIFTLAGAFVMLLLVICYHRFYWWPIHPIGYLTAYSSAMWILWFSFLVGWLCNALCMRYGGVMLYKKLRFFFIGLIIGDFLMAGSWAIYGFFSYASYMALPV